MPKFSHLHNNVATHICGSSQGAINKTPAMQEQHNAQFRPDHVHHARRGGDQRHAVHQRPRLIPFRAAPSQPLFIRRPTMKALLIRIFNAYFDSLARSPYPAAWMF
ncbi:hypothetical protein [Aurantiacibacter xanthus]|uniref:hypothetical protein n=1 Tax=Aurantiacibacter xanthus TaxID=1784712 RepID=UPI0011C22272|nr:hypothetical protein [Aurantiacibacter xanthus]